MKGVRRGWLHGGECLQARKALLCLLLILAQALATFPASASADFAPAPVDSPIDDMDLLPGTAVLAESAYQASVRRARPVAMANGPAWQYAAAPRLPAAIVLSPTASTVFRHYLSRAPPVSLSSRQVSIDGKK